MPGLERGNGGKTQLAGQLEWPLLLQLAYREARGRPGLALAGSLELTQRKTLSLV